MTWLQVTVPVRRDEAAVVETIMERSGALAVTLADAGDNPQIEPPLGTTPLWEHTQVSGLFADDAVGRVQVETLTVTLHRFIGTVAAVTRLADQVWERVWLDDFGPIRFGRRLWICPHGQRPPDRDAVVVALDPGLAFGTGHHPTTALCLTWLDAHRNLAGGTLIDYGCGSGILAIAAVKLGAVCAFAVDLDPQAIEATQANAEANGVSARIHAGLPEALPPLQADLLVANILAAPLITLATEFAARLGPGGALALSGILSDQVAAVVGAYAPHFALDAPRLDGDWVLLSGRRRAS